MTPETGVSLAACTSLRVGGAADYFLVAASGQDLVDGLRWARQQAVPVRIIGGGSNLLIAEGGVEGLVIKTANARGAVEQRGGLPVLVADAGATLANLARRVAKQGFGGLEWAANVPGTLGGAAVNNAGAFGADLAGCLLGLTLVDATGRRQRLGADDLAYGYRSSALKRRELGDVAVERVELALRPSTPASADGLVKRFSLQRMQTQPRLSSAGSVFANPEGGFAGQLIEQAGLKGAHLGGAHISEQHANFIVNPGGARARDVYGLVRRAQDEVFARSGTWLRPEIELLGRWSDAERRALSGPSGVEPGERDRDRVAHAP